MKNQDLKKEATDVINEVKGDIKGVIVLATNEKKSEIFIGGKSTTIVNMLAGAIIGDKQIRAIVSKAIFLAALEMASSLSDRD